MTIFNIPISLLDEKYKTEVFFGNSIFVLIIKDSIPDKLVKYQDIMSQPYIDLFVKDDEQINDSLVEFIANEIKKNYTVDYYTRIYIIYDDRLEEVAKYLNYKLKRYLI